VRGGRAVGVRLEGGRTIDAEAVVSTADPKRTFLQMVEPEAPARRIPPRRRRDQNARGRDESQLRIVGAAPVVCGVQDARSASSGKHVHRTLDRLCEDAFLDAKYGRPSEHPWLEVVTQSGPRSVCRSSGETHAVDLRAIQPVPPRLGSWDELKEPYGDCVIETLSEYAPNVPKAILARDVITPLDLERRFGLTEAHQSHGEMGPDQFFSFRRCPVGRITVRRSQGSTCAAPARIPEAGSAALQGTTGPMRSSRIGRS